MPATHNIDDVTKLIITTWDGEATDRDFLKALEKYQQKIQCDPDYLDYNEEGGQALHLRQ